MVFKANLRTQDMHLDGSEQTENSMKKIAKLLGETSSL
jgi:hypothetical protein